MATSKVPCDHGDHHPAAVLFDGEDLKLLRIIATSAPHVLELEVLSKPDTAELCRKALALVDGRDHLVLRRATLLHPFARMRVDIDRQSHHAYESIFIIGADTPGARADTFPAASAMAAVPRSRGGPLDPGFSLREPRDDRLRALTNPSSAPG